jgi:hypothetical protein
MERGQYPIPNKNILTTRTKREPAIATGHTSMSPNPQPEPDRDQLEAATDQAIAVCGGGARDAVKALIFASEFLESEVCELTLNRRPSRPYTSYKTADP